jgi:hypothetical protein
LPWYGAKVTGHEPETLPADREYLILEGTHFLERAGTMNIGLSRTHLRETGAALALLALVGGIASAGRVAARAESASRAQGTVAEERDNQTILRGIVGYGKAATIFINDQQVPTGANGSYSNWVDVSRFVRPGENVLRIEGDDLRLFNVTVSHAETRGKFRRLGMFANTPTRASRQEPPYVYRFSLPGDARQDVPGGNAPRAGSRDNQTLLVTGSIKPVTAYVNGRRVGDFQVGNKLDISNFIRPGENRLRVTWTDRTYPFVVRIAHAKSKNAFYDVTKLQVTKPDERARGEKEVLFTVPK